MRGVGPQSTRSESARSYQVGAGRARGAARVGPRSRGRVSEATPKAALYYIGVVFLSVVFTFFTPPRVVRARGREDGGGQIF